MSHSHTERLSALLDEACELLERAQSGYISGSGPDMQYDTDKQRVIKESRELLSDENDLGVKP